MAFGLIAFSFLRMGGIDQEELKAIQEEQKRQAEDAKAAWKGTPTTTGQQQKIKVSRPRR